MCIRKNSKWIPDKGYKISILFGKNYVQKCKCKDIDLYKK